VVLELRTCSGRQKLPLSPLPTALFGTDMTAVFTWMMSKAWLRQSNVCNLVDNQVCWLTRERVAVKNSRTLYALDWGSGELVPCMVCW
jgi:hypothetical protein